MAIISFIESIFLISSILGLITNKMDMCIFSFITYVCFKVIANIRYADRRTYEFCCDGISSNSTIAIGTYGTIKNKEDRYFFCEGLSVVVKILSPKNIVVYGSAPSSIFGEYEKAGIKIVSFENNYWADHIEKK